MNTTANFDTYLTKYCFKKKKGFTDKAKNIKLLNSINNTKKILIINMYKKALFKLANVLLEIFISLYLLNLKYDFLKFGKFKLLNFYTIFLFSIKLILNGIKILNEHTNNQYIALKIALDHLTLHKDYYSKLITLGL